VCLPDLLPLLGQLWVRCWVGTRLDVTGRGCEYFLQLGCRTNGKARPKRGTSLVWEKVKGSTSRKGSEKWDTQMWATRPSFSPSELFRPPARIDEWRSQLPNDSEIWEGICRGDAAVFDCFYREHAPRLRAFVQQIVGNRHAAEDVAQETFAQVWNRPNGYQPERGALRAYLFGIGRKRASEWWRQQRPAEPVADEAPPCRTETHSLVSDAFQRLPEEQRTLLWLREVEGHS
jgi:RNA polymerase sigma factor (sigma-70 family)